jgi:hypothetical protein
MKTTYRVAVLDAVDTLDAGDSKGVSLVAIRKHVTNSFQHLDAKSHHLAAALKKAVDKGELIKVRASFARKPAAAAPPVTSTAKKPKKPKAAKAAPSVAADEDDNVTMAESDMLDEEVLRAPTPVAADDDEVLNVVDDELDDEVLGVGDSCIVEGSSSDYEVTRDSVTTWHCTCPAFKFKKKDSYVAAKTCKHIDAVRTGDVDPISIKRAPPKAVAAASQAALAVLAAPAPLAKSKAAGKSKRGKQAKKGKSRATADADDDDDDVAEEVGAFSFASLTVGQLKECLRANDTVRASACVAARAVVHVPCPVVAMRRTETNGRTFHVSLRRVHALSRGR